MMKVSKIMQHFLLGVKKFWGLVFGRICYCTWILRESFKILMSEDIIFLRKVVKGEFEIVRMTVARNPNTPIEDLARLARDVSKRVRRSVAENPSTPAEEFVELIRDEEVLIRIRAAENPGIPAEDLVILARDEDSWVRAGVARNPIRL